MPRMSDLKPPSQNRPGAAPWRCRTAMRRVAFWVPTLRNFRQRSLIWGHHPGRSARPACRVSPHAAAECKSADRESVRRPAAGQGWGSVSNGYGDNHVPPRTLAGATILQIVPALREEPVARTAVNVAYALLQSGARALIAAEEGPLVSELKAFGGERVITPSNYAAAPVMARYELPRERLTIIPRSIDTAAFDPAAIAPERVEAVRKAWHVGDDMRILLVPGRVAPWNGQLLLPDIARALIDEGMRGFVLVAAGENRRFRKYARFVAEQARAKGVQAAVRLTGHCRDMPAAFAAADTVVVPAVEPPVLGRVVAEAQAAGRPVVASDIGILPEHVVTPPEMPEDVRTGWVVEPGDAAEFARAIGAAFALDDTAYRAMTARARQFAEYMFSPQSVAAAARAVYTSLLARDV